MYIILQITKNNRFEEYIDKIRLFLKDLIDDYPLHDRWFAGVTQELREKTGSREILFVINELDEIIGVSILKNTNLEKKICTFRVAEKYQHKGIGSKLMEMSLSFLNTDKPIITVSSTKLLMFYPIFKKFHFEPTKVYLGKYRKSVMEYCYNGVLLPESILKLDSQAVNGKTV